LREHREEFTTSTYVLNFEKEGSTRNIPIYLNFLIAIALPQNPAGALFQIARPLRAVEVLQGNELVLYVGADAHFLSGAEDYPDLPAAYLGEKLFFL
jgi:hypothetical protein